METSFVRVKRRATALPGRAERWGHGGHVGAPMFIVAEGSPRAASLERLEPPLSDQRVKRRATALPGRAERWGHGGHVGAPMFIDGAHAVGKRPAAGSQAS